MLRVMGDLVSENPGLLLSVPEVRNMLTKCRYEVLMQEGMDEGAGEAETSIKGAVHHNLSNMHKMLALDRPQLLIAPLISVDAIAKKRGDMKVLSIGPRTEAEILALYAHGFCPENIKALDLFSYSPWIDVGDIHDMPYDDQQFDLVLLGWILAYSKDVQTACSEVVRVARKGAYISVGCEYQPMSLEEYKEKHTPDENMMFKTTSDILALFGEHVGEVIFRGEIDETEMDQVGNLVTIFRRT